MNTNLFSYKIHRLSEAIAFPLCLGVEVAFQQLKNKLATLELAVMTEGRTMT